MDNQKHGTKSVTCLIILDYNTTNIPVSHSKESSHFLHYNSHLTSVEVSKISSSDSESAEYNNVLSFASISKLEKPSSAVKTKRELCVYIV